MNPCPHAGRRPLTQLECEEAGVTSGVAACGHRGWLCDQCKTDTLDAAIEAIRELTDVLRDHTLRGTL